MPDKWAPAIEISADTSTAFASMRVSASGVYVHIADYESMRKQRDDLRRDLNTALDRLSNQPNEGQS